MYLSTSYTESHVGEKPTSIGINQFSLENKPDIIWTLQILHFVSSLLIRNIREFLIRKNVLLVLFKKVGNLFCKYQGE